MDDIVDLEMEKIDAILDKIENDPENIDVKRTELNLWKKIKQKCIEGRRTGVGITAEGDMLAALNKRYGTDEALNFSVKVHKTLALEAYRSSVEMAKERGAFPIYDAIREEKNPMINRIKEADPALYDDMTQYDTNPPERSPSIMAGSSESGTGSQGATSCASGSKNTRTSGTRRSAPAVSRNGAGETGKTDERFSRRTTETATGMAASPIGKRRFHHRGSWRRKSREAASTYTTASA